MVSAVVLLTVIIVGFIGFLVIEKNRKFAFNDFDKVDIPYVTIDVQGHKLNMIVDTACGLSILHKKSIETVGLQYTATNSKTNVTALTEEKVALQNVIVPLIINGKEEKVSFSLFESDTNFSDFRTHFGIVMHGLLGSDFLDKYKCVINYKKHTLSIK